MKKISCTLCDGAKTIPVNDDGKVEECYRCEGMGEIIVDEQLVDTIGVEKELDPDPEPEMVTCSYYDGAGDVDCDECSSSGEVECEECNGEGEIEA